MEYKLPPLPKNLPNVVRRLRACEGEVAAQVVFEHALNEYAIAAIEAQGVPDGLALQIEAAVTQAQKVLSAWNEWYGMHGKNAPIPPAGIVNAQDLLAVARSLLASAPPAPQAKPQPLSDDRDARIAELEQRNRDLYEDVQRFKEHALNEKAARLELERQLEEARRCAAAIRALKGAKE